MVVSVVVYIIMVSCIIRSNFDIEGTKIYSFSCKKMLFVAIFYDFYCQSIFEISHNTFSIFSDLEKRKVILQQKALRIPNCIEYLKASFVTILMWPFCRLITEHWKFYIVVLQMKTNYNIYNRVVQQMIIRAVAF